MHSPDVIHRPATSAVALLHPTPQIHDDNETPRPPLFLRTIGVVLSAVGYLIGTAGALGLLNVSTQMLRGGLAPEPLFLTILLASVAAAILIIGNQLQRVGLSSTAALRALCFLMTVAAAIELTRNVLRHW